MVVVKRKGPPVVSASILDATLSPKRQKSDSPQKNSWQRAQDASGRDNREVISGQRVANEERIPLNVCHERRGSIQSHTLELTDDMKTALRGLGLDDKAQQIVAKHFSEHEIPQLRRAFDDIDADGNGEISPNELMLLFHRSGLSVAEVDELMVSMDEDGSGGIDFKEFICFMAESIDTFVKVQNTGEASLATVQESSRLYRTLYCLFQVEQRKQNFRMDKFIVSIFVYGPLGFLTLWLPDVRHVVEAYMSVPPPYASFAEFQWGLFWKWFPISVLLVMPSIPNLQLDLAQAFPAIALFLITDLRLAFISALSGKSSSAQGVDAYPFLDRTEEGKIYRALNMMGSPGPPDHPQGTPTLDQAARTFLSTVPSMLRWLAVLCHALLPAFVTLDSLDNTLSKDPSQYMYLAAAALMSGLTFDRLLYLSTHVLADNVATVRRLRAFCTLTSPDEYYRERKAMRQMEWAQQSLDFPPFLNLRDSKDILRWIRTRELLLKISNSHEQQSHDVHLSLIVACTLVLCCVVVMARIFPATIANLPVYMLPLVIFDVFVLSVFITLTLLYTTRSYGIQKQHLKTLQQEHFHLMMLMKSANDRETMQDAADLLQHTHSYLEQCDILPCLLGFEVNEVFVQTVVTVLGTSFATGLSYLFAID